MSAARPGLARLAARIASRSGQRIRAALSRDGWRTLSFICIAGGLVLLSRGAFSLSSISQAGASGLAILWSALACGLLLRRANSHLPFLPFLNRESEPPRGLRGRLFAIEGGALLIVTSFAILQATGGTRSLLHPLIYALAAFLASMHTGWEILPLGLMLIAGEVLLFQGDGRLAREPAQLAVHGAFILLFSSLHALFLRGEIARQRRAHALHVSAEIRRMREEACEFRLLGAGSPAESSPLDRASEEVFLAQGAVAVIRKNLRSMVELLKHSLGLETCAVYWLDERTGRLRLKEFCAAGPSPLAELGADAGALGTIVKNRVPLNLRAPKPSHLPYYGDPKGAASIAAFLGVPILDQDRLLGVLIGDRQAQAPLPDHEGDTERTVLFTPREESLLVESAAQVLHALKSERAFSMVERRKYEHERLHRASERLNHALTPEQVHKTAFQAVREIVDFDFAAITSYSRQERQHTVAAVDGDAPFAPQLPGLSFSDNAGLVSMAVKNRHALPGEGVLRDPEIPVFEDKLGLRGMHSLLVLPLICAGEVIGTLVLASQREHLFGKEQREMLAVLANQVAVSVENGRMYKAMEAMATTDGLTGLVSRRAFHERFAEMLGRAERQGKSLTLLLTDVDHFKKVNDTYGHPVGDVVLRRVAQVLGSCVRKIDLAARYGGEEFAVVLEATDRLGGRQLAERVLREVARLSFHSDKGPFRCTLSVGMATFPLDGREEQVLIAHADQALYHAKQNGRNQAVAFDELGEIRRAAG